MEIRLAVLGAALVVLGLLDLGPFSHYTTIAGGVGLLAAGGVWLRKRGPVGAKPALVASVVINGALPLVVYLLLRPHLASEAAALAIALAVPVAGTIVICLVRRKVDAIGVVAVLAYGVALLVLLLSGGNTFVLKLQESVVSGPLGLVMLGSAAVRRPLLLTVSRLVKKDQGPVDPSLERARRHASTVLTVIMGTTLVVHAAALAVLALVLSSGGVLAVSRAVGLAIIGAGLLVVLWYRNRTRTAVRPA